MNTLANFESEKQTGGGYDGARYAWAPPIKETIRDPILWRGTNMRANTDARYLGGPGPMRLQGKRFASAWEECTKASEPRVWSRMVDHQLCACCGYRIDLDKHDYYTLPGGEMQCDRCEWLESACPTCGLTGCV